MAERDMPGILPLWGKPGQRTKRRFVFDHTASPEDNPLVGELMALPLRV
jgi:hypothetical protein